MKSLYVTLCNTSIDNNTLNELLQSKSPNTFFPGYWSLSPETSEIAKENILSSISIAINHSIKSPEYDCIIFGLGVGEHRIVNELLSRIDQSECDVKIINVTEVENLISKRKI